MSRLETERRSFLDAFLDFFGCCGFGRRSSRVEIAADQVLQPLTLSNGRVQTTIGMLLEQSQSARLKCYNSIGKLDPMALQASHQGESLVGGPRWPSGHQYFRMIHRPCGTIVLISDGLSDPFDDLQPEANQNGFGLEFYIETPAEELGKSSNEVKSSWQFQLLYTVCSLAAGHGSIRQIIDDMLLCSTEAEGVAEAIPSTKSSNFVNKAGRVGALLGLSDSDSTDQPKIPPAIHGMPISDVRLISIKLLTLPELGIITDVGAEGRRKLDEIFRGQDRLVSSLERLSAL